MSISRLSHSLAVITLLAIIPTGIICQHKSKVTDSQFHEPGVYLKTYRLSLPPPKDFADFDHFELERLPSQEHGEIKLDQRGNAPIGGRLETTDKIIYKFKRALLIFGKDDYEQLEFTTAKVKDVYYKFEGRILEKEEEEGGQYTKLRGVLTKYKDGKIIASAKLAFYQWAWE
ncbi:MAG: hypothetical protein QOC96_3261 [Acidobacteriota bacterium]|jgi:hypothetical protein|nr:hypothetical protein [Acidobacteriota bacterium]